MGIRKEFLFKLSIVCPTDAWPVALDSCRGERSQTSSDRVSGIASIGIPVDELGISASTWISRSDRALRRGDTPVSLTSIFSTRNVYAVKLTAAPTNRSGHTLAAPNLAAAACFVIFPGRIGALRILDGCARRRGAARFTFCCIFWMPKRGSDAAVSSFTSSGMWIRYVPGKLFLFRCGNGLGPPEFLCAVGDLPCRGTESSCGAILHFVDAGRSPLSLSGRDDGALSLSGICIHVTGRFALRGEA